MRIKARIIKGKRQGRQRVTSIVKDGGRFFITRSAASYVKKEVNKAVRKGTIDIKDRKFCENVLVEGAIKAAIDMRVSRVGVAHVKSGWRGYIKTYLCPGNAPPHECMKRSIIENKHVFDNIIIQENQ